MRILCIDVGTGTQDILLFDSSIEIENCVQMVMPSPTQIIARRVRAATAERKSLFLTGVTMGGGPGSWAVEDHIKQGLSVYALPDPARTFDDDLERVAQMGVQVLQPEEFESRWQSAEAEGGVLIKMQDLDLPAVHRALQSFNEPPEYDALAVAVFDHGAAPPGYSDRRFRFDYISRQMRVWGGQHIAQALAAFAAPAGKVHPDLTRLLAVAQSAQAQAPGVPLLLMDTGPAALLGSLGDPVVRQAAYHNSLFVNVGNFHTLAFHIVKNHIYALFEHHTGLLDSSKLVTLLEKLASGELTNQEIFEDSGHGALNVRKVSGVPTTIDFENLPPVQAEEDSEPDAEALATVAGLVDPDSPVRLARDIDQALTKDGVPADDPVNIYLREIIKTPPLTPEEEQDLIYKMAKGREAHALLSSRGVDLFTAAEQLTSQDDETGRLLLTLKEGKKAKEILVQANLRLVVSITSRYMGRGLSLLDLIQEGNIGLMKAADRFEPSNGYRFPIYAAWWIRKYILRAISDRGRTTVLPAHVAEMLARIRRATHQLQVELGREPTEEEIGKRLDISGEKVRKILDMALHPPSLDAPTEEAEDNFLSDFIEDERALTPEEQVARERLKKQVESILGSLAGRERQILEMRYGLSGNRPHTLEAVAKALGMTRERIRQLETRILTKMRYNRYRPHHVTDKPDVTGLPAALNWPATENREKPGLCAVTGPRRGMLAGIDTPWPVYMAVPHGDMMLAGCFGLLRAFAVHFPESAEEISKRLDV